MHARLATPSDTQELLQMMQELYQHDAVPFQPATITQGLELWFHSQTASPSPLGRVWIFEQDNLVAGYMVLAFDFSLEFGGRCAFIDELFIAAPFRNQGHGTWALQLAKAEATQHGAGALLLEAALSNDRATALYRRHGFVEHARRLMSVRL